MLGRKLNEDFTVAGQIGPEDVAAIAAAGYRSIICNRPDGEAPDQPGYAEIEAAARQHGLAIVHIPVYHSGITQANVDDTARAVAEMDKPIFAYCRSGARSANVLQLAVG